MNEDFVTYEIAKKLKDKGFNETCLAYYTNDNTLYYNFSHKAGACCIDCLLSHNLMPKDSVSGKFVDAPTTAQALKWLIKEKGIFVEISPAYIDITYYVSVYKNKNGRYFKHYISELKYKSYEQAAIAGIEYVLDNIIKEQQ
ncbi:MAG: hypothetical protein J6B82_05680 [Bacteroidaceae bacterium]|nr:hypothetical protein [Bacteroidaceae bacterium]